MIDLHTHSLLSDGELLPAELIRRAEDKGIEVIAITDHVDQSNIDMLIPMVVNACRELNKCNMTKAIPGAELTHIPPALIKDMIIKARGLGAKIVVVHGETTAEPVMKGTNLEAIKGGADILAHPGIITYDEALLAKKNNVCLEISGRGGHCLTNGHVLKTGLKAGVKLLFNTDSHKPSDLMSREKAAKCIKGAGMEEDMIESIFNNSKELVKCFI